jgi:hypothetical protein
LPKQDVLERVDEELILVDLGLRNMQRMFDLIRPRFRAFERHKSLHQSLLPLLFFRISGWLAQGA